MVHEPPQSEPAITPPNASAPGAPEASSAVAPMDDEYTPTSPAASQTAAAAEPAAADTAAAETEPHATADTNDLPRVPSELLSISEPSEEPPAAQSTPHSTVAPMSTTNAERAQPPTLDPHTASLYEPIDAETFQQRRLRFNRQETMSFAPLRPRHSAETAPYDPARRPASSADDTF